MTTDSSGAALGPRTRRDAAHRHAITNKQDNLISCDCVSPHVILASPLRYFSYHFLNVYMHQSHGLNQVIRHVGTGFQALTPSQIKRSVAAWLGGCHIPLRKVWCRKGRRNAWGEIAQGDTGQHSADHCVISAVRHRLSRRCTCCSSTPTRGTK